MCKGDAQHTVIGRHKINSFTIYWWEQVIYNRKHEYWALSVSIQASVEYSKNGNKKVKTVKVEIKKDTSNFLSSAYLKFRIYAICKHQGKR